MKWVNGWAIRALLKSLSSRLSQTERQEVEHLITHDECGEALRTLAWIIVEEKKKVPSEAIRRIKELSAGLVATEDMPPDLDAYAE